MRSLFSTVEPNWKKSQKSKSLGREIEGILPDGEQWKIHSFNQNPVNHEETRKLSEKVIPSVPVKKVEKENSKNSETQIIHTAYGGNQKRKQDNRGCFQNRNRFSVFEPGMINPHHGEKRNQKGPQNVLMKRVKQSAAVYQVKGNF